MKKKKTSKNKKELNNDNHQRQSIIKFSIDTLIVIIISFVCCYFISPLIDKINFGLDLQGGFEVLYEV